MNGLGIVIAIVMGYVFGCIQTAYVIGRLAGRIDIRKHGSQNAGASNITTVLGWKYGVITAVIDILKAVVPVLIMRKIYPEDITLAFLCGAFVIIGHIFPLNLGFKGGKGAASIIGMFAALDIRIALIIALALVVITLIFDYIALGSIAMFTAAPVLIYIMGYPEGAVIICIGLAIICYYKHYINIIRIVKGEETGLRKVIKKNKKNK